MFLVELRKVVKVFGLKEIENMTAILSLANDSLRKQNRKALMFKAATKGQPNYFVT